MVRPRHAKKDANQSQIETELAEMGYYVADVSQLAHLGFDLLVLGHKLTNYAPTWLAVEVKSDEGRLTEREEKVAAELQYRYGDEAPLMVARCAEDVVDWFQARE